MIYESRNDGIEFIEDQLLEIGLTQIAAPNENEFRRSPMKYQFVEEIEVLRDENASL